MKESKKSCDCSTCLLCNLSIEDWLPAIKANKVNYSFKKGETIFKEGDKLTGIYFVFSGMVKVHKEWNEGKELIVRFAWKGDILGHRGLGSNLLYSVSATALEDSIVCFFDVNFFKQSTKLNSDFTYRLLMFFADELKESEQRMYSLAHIPVKSRVLHALEMLQNKFGVDDEGAIAVKLSRQDISSYIGSTYESFFRALAELEKDGTVETNGKKIKLNK
jgi:CRP/FNR family transcriptional regulator